MAIATCELQPQMITQNVAANRKWILHEPQRCTECNGEIEKCDGKIDGMNGKMRWGKKPMM